MTRRQRPLLGETGLLRPARTAGTRRTSRAGGRLLSGPRSRRYLDLLGHLDGSASVTALRVDEIAGGIRREFDEKWSAVPLGIVSCCYLGVPFEVHTLEPTGSIIEHYRTGEPMPDGLDQARRLAMADTYLAIEVYPNRLVCVHEDGSTVEIGGTT